MPGGRSPEEREARAANARHAARRATARQTPSPCPHRPATVGRDDWLTEVDRATAPEPSGSGDRRSRAAALGARRSPRRSPRSCSRGRLVPALAVPAVPRRRRGRGAGGGPAGRDRRTRSRELLEENGVISSAVFFELRAAPRRPQRRPQAGPLQLREDMSYGAALDAPREGRRRRTSSRSRSPRAARAARSRRSSTGWTGNYLSGDPRARRCSTRASTRAGARAEPRGLPVPGHLRAQGGAAGRAAWSSASSTPSGATSTRWT